MFVDFCLSGKGGYLLIRPWWKEWIFTDPPSGGGGRCLLISLLVVKV